VKKPIEFQDVNDWLETFDADCACGILTDILNNQIKIEELADSVLLHALDYIKEANICRENMYRRKK